MNKVIKSIVSLCLAFAMCIGVTSVAQTAPNSYIVADAAVTTADSYYDGITATSGNALLGQLHDLITSSRTKYSSYNDCRDLAKNSDPGPNGVGVMEFYTQESITTFSGTVGTWNREHVWPKADSNGLWKSETVGGGADMHHIRPAEAKLNSNRGNKLYGVVSSHSSSNEEYSYNTSGQQVTLGGYSNSNTFEPLDNVKGDVARILMYVYTHYNNYTNAIFGGNASTNGSSVSGYQSKYFGTLNFTHIITASNEDAAKQLLLQWNKLDPVDTIETTRNDVVYGIQGNRNPFIDNPSYADAIWGDGTVVNPNPPTPDVTLTGLSMNAATLTLNAGSTYDLTVTATPSGASNSVSWSSSDTTVATVANGKVSAKKAGTAIITATSSVDSTIKATATVTVKEASTPAPTPSDTFGAGTYKISIDLTAASDVKKVLYFNGGLANSYYLGTTDNEANAAEVEVAEVTGGYTLKTGGKYIEVVMSGEHFNVVLNSSSTGAWKYDSDLNTVTWRIDTNGNDYYLGTRTLDSGKTYTTISASDTKYITGDNADKVGVTQFIIEFVKVGGTTPVDPDTPLENIEVNPSTITLEKGQTASLSAVPVPSNATADIVWTSSDSTVATVSANGTVTAVKKGEAVIKASSKDNPAIYGEATVNVTAEDDPVTPPAQTIAIVPDAITVKVGQSSSVKVVNHLGADVDRAEYNLEISDETVAGIDGGSISGKKVGECTLTATLKSDPTVKATAKISVEAADEVKPESENVKKFVAAVAKMAGISDETTMRDMYSLIVDAVKIYNTLNADEKENVATVKVGLEVIINMYNLSVKAANSAAESAEGNALGGVGGYIKRGE